MKSAMAWLPATIGYVIAIGALGITAKLALQRGAWPALVVWAAVAYAVAAIVLVLFGKVTIRADVSSLLGFVAGAMAVVGLIFLYVALDRGPVGKVVPLTSVYPALTVLLAVAFLGERVTLTQLLGLGAVVLGVVLITVSR